MKSRKKNQLTDILLDYFSPHEFTIHNDMLYKYKRKDRLIACPFYIWRLTNDQNNKI